MCDGGNAAIAESWWKQFGVWAIDTANSNSWASAEKAILRRSSADVVLGQETKLLAAPGAQVPFSQGKRAGWRVCATPAHRTALGKGSGGCFIATTRSIGLHEHAGVVKLAVRHRLHAGHVQAVMRGGIHVVSIWLIDGVGLSPENLMILEHAAEVILKLRGPWVIGGDWNLLPSVLEASKWLELVGGIIVATALTTCHSSTYDFFVVSEGLEGAVLGVQRIDDAGLHPHYPSRLLLAGNARSNFVRKLVRPPAVPGALPQGPLPTPACLDLQLGDCPTAQGIQSATLAWFAGAHREWTSLTGVRGALSEAAFRWVAAPGPVACRHHSPSAISVAWRVLATRAEECANILRHPSPGAADVVARQVRKMLMLIAKWGETATAPTAASWVHTVVKIVNAVSSDPCAGGHSTLRGLIHMARQKAVKIEIGISATATKEWTGWIKGNPATSEAGKRPTKRAFRYVKGLAGWESSSIGRQIQNDEANQMADDAAEGDEAVMADDGSARTWTDPDSSGHVPLSEQADVEGEGDAWAGVWQEGAQYSVSPQSIDPAGTEKPPALGCHMLRAAAWTFPADTGLGGDNVSPRAFARLSDTVLDALALLLMAFEHVGEWPSAVALVLVVLLPKNDGGRRPIGLFESLVRLWMRARAPVARRWEAEHDRACMYGSAGKGAQRAAWQSAFRAESASLSDDEFVQSLLDLVKAFDNVPHDVIVRAARKHGFCLWVLRLSLAAYRMPRSVGIGGVYSRLIIATRGIAAGSGFAVSELRALMLDIVDSTLRRWPLLDIALYVDDMTLEGRGTYAAARDMVAAATSYVVAEFVSMRMQVHVKKSVVTASRFSLANATARATRTQCLTPTRQAKMLGVSAGGGRRRAVKHLRVRTTAFKKRIPRIHSLRRIGINASTLTRLAGTPMVTYGVEVCGMSESHLQDSRSSVARAAAPAGRGKNIDIVLAMLDGASGTLDPAFDAHARPVLAWAMAWWQSWQSPAELESAVAKAVLKLARAANSIWRLVCGPATALVATLVRLKWSFVNRSTVIDDLGQHYDATLDSPAAIADAVKRSVRRWRLARISRHLPGLAPTVPDIGDTGLGPLLILDMMPAASRLVASKTSCKSVAAWERKHASQLLSAATGGQWPQTRLAAVRHWTDDARCQLCLAQPGTMLHRHRCSSTMPHGGWQAAPAKADLFLRGVSRARQSYAMTRGLLLVGVATRAADNHDTFEWLRRPPPDGSEESWTWYIDGSLMDGPWQALRRTGFGIVVTDPVGNLIAFGRGRPPRWVDTSGGAEAWAYHVVTSLTAFPPQAVTDCQEVRTTLLAGRHAATGAKKKLARIWALTFHNLDGCNLAAGRNLVWMPAHKSMSAIGCLRKSNGGKVNEVDWRASRLVDILAKSVATSDAVPREVMAEVAAAQSAAEYSAATLGVVTFAANNHSVPGIGIDGLPCVRICRDSLPRQGAALRRRLHRQEVLPPPPSIAATMAPARLGIKRIRSDPPLVAAGRAKKRRLALATEAARSCRVDAEGVARWISERQYAPASGPTAASRMEQLRRRIQEKSEARLMSNA